MDKGNKFCVFVFSVQQKKKGYKFPLNLQFVVLYFNIATALFDRFVTLHSKLIFSTSKKESLNIIRAKFNHQ